jgi:hypothetical protein
MGPAICFSIDELKALRVQIDAAIQIINKMPASKDGPKSSDGQCLYYLAYAQADIKLREAKMWVGKMMEGLGSELPQEFRDQAPQQEKVEIVGSAGNA